MRLYESFKEVVGKRGGYIVCHMAFLNLLNDMNAFEDEDKVAFKEIMRELYKDGLPERIVGEGKWNGVCQHHIDNFVKANGYQRHIVDYIVKCLVYSIGWISKSEMARAYNDYVSFGEQKPKSITKTVHTPTTKHTTRQPKPKAPPTEPTVTSPHPPPNLPQQSWLSKNAAWLVPCVIVLLLVAMVASQLISKSQVEKVVKEKETQMLASDTVFNVMPDELLGNYSVKLESNGQVRRLTGFIDRDRLGLVTLHILSEYEPMLFTLSIESNGKITNFDLGEAYLIHKKSIDKRTICFQKDNNKCALTR